MMKQYILKDRKPIHEPDILKWGEWYGDIKNRVVKRTEVGGCEVSTVFLGLDHSFDDGPPVLFETLVFGGPLDEEMERYHAWEEAEKGHQDMVERVRRAAA